MIRSSLRRLFRVSHFEPKVFAVDFDGTIVTDEFPEIGRERKRITRLLRRLHAQGHVLILWTCRMDQPERQYLSEAVDFLCFHWG